MTYVKRGVKEMALKKKQPVLPLSVWSTLAAWEMFGMVRTGKVSYEHLCHTHA